MTSSAINAGPSADMAGGASGAIPGHVAIIMDGNGRWAAARGLPRSMGHRKGVDAVREAVEAAAENGIGYLTLFAFSSENWNRHPSEVRDLMGLLRMYLKSEIKALDKEDIRLRVIGRRDNLADDINRMIDEAEALTHDNTRMTLVIALSYGGRGEIVDAARAIATAVVEGRESLENITEERFASFLSTHDIPDPDLIIRTSGEQRISNFLLWQTAYAELLFLDVLWPDFGEDHFTHALQWFAGRERRFGTRP
ncbi:isoprenyl transferase [Eilatimonas milleporae]|uniref:Isoprenyl transferase n=1 Tax=Eilatimonas milleporae TaxID=911205 RepID=A0A3M0CGR7_9PROT|nr:isoprenyl transferase [Eilatimonas milleporae]RMB08814.1 undecaprenyl pyrophosphate synthetase [Eilatimonas milleporae]